MTATIELNAGLNAFIEYYHNNDTKSCWLGVYDHPNESPDNEKFTDRIATLDSAKRLALKKEQENLRLLNNLPLW